jgi:quinol monooxygenase YgiN
MKVIQGKQDEAVAAFRAAMAGSTAEAGCIEYRFTADLDDIGVHHILEIWEDEPSLLAHFQGRAFKDFMAVAGDLVEPLSFVGYAGAMEPYALAI